MSPIAGTQISKLCDQIDSQIDELDQRLRELRQAVQSAPPEGADQLERFARFQQEAPARLRALLEQIEPTVEGGMAMEFRDPGGSELARRAVQRFLRTQIIGIAQQVGDKLEVRPIQGIEIRGGRIQVRVQPDQHRPMGGPAFDWPPKYLGYSPDEADWPMGWPPRTMLVLRGASDEDESSRGSLGELGNLGDVPGPVK